MTRKRVGRPRRSADGKPSTSVLHVLCTAAEHATIHAGADAAGVLASDLVRNSAVKAAEKALRRQRVAK